MIWSFLNTGFSTGKFNMELDEHLAMNYFGKPLLRVFGWKPYCISLGYNQNIEDINLNICKENGIDVVRRPTGGRAILHSDELTYSVIMESDGRSISEVYRFISLSLLRGLRGMGADVDFSKSQAYFPDLYKNKSSVPCFTSSARYEIEYKNKKLVGSAQRRFGNIVLQHGSILIGDYHKNLPLFLSDVLTENIKEQIINEIDEKTITLNDILGKKMSFDELSFYIKKGFEDENNLIFDEIKLEDIK